MADSQGRGSTRAQRARGSSRASGTSSARSSAVFDDHLYPAPPHYNHSLRPVQSRFSLNEQFAATRRDYEFGFDDASSFLERSTIASDVHYDADQDRTLTLDSDLVVIPPAGPSSTAQNDRIYRTYYELLCLSQDAGVSPSQIRRAYFRLFSLLHANKLMPQYQQSADAYFSDAQIAFETLIEPLRKMDYDEAILRLVDVDEDGESSLDGSEGEPSGLDTKQRAWLKKLRYRQRQGITDFGISINASGLFNHGQGQRRHDLERARLLDLTFSKSKTIGIPALGREIEARIQSIRKTLNIQAGDKQKQFQLYCSIPTVTVAGSLYALFDNRALAQATLLAGRYHAVLPETIPKNRFMTLVPLRISPLASIKIRQELFWRPSRFSSSGHLVQEATLPDAVVEIETDSLPGSSVTARVSNHIRIQDEEEPLHIETSLSSARSWRPGPPRVGLALHRRVRDGTVFACVDSGTWIARQSRECQYLSDFSRFGKRARLASAYFPSPATFEVGFKFSPNELGLRAGRGFTKQAEGGIRELDADIDIGGEGSWTVSAAVTSGSLAGYLRYGRDLLSTSDRSRKSRSGFRMELELCADSFRDGYLALRSLKRVGQASKVGVEVGISSQDLSLSLYFSRLGDRVIVPFIVANRAFFSTELLFWSTFLPFMGFAALEFSVWRPWRTKSTAQGRGIRDFSRDELQNYVAKRRAEADELTMVLAGPVEPRQRAERQIGGLVIVSAKYGVKNTSSINGWASEEVADVTVAVASLVDDGQLLIPKGLRKSHLLGFWDPAPLRTKVLHVRYLFKGKEQVVEVSGRDELMLPRKIDL